jgi:hypothetical protein
MDRICVPDAETPDGLLFILLGRSRPGRKVDCPTTPSGLPMHLAVDLSNRVVLAQTLINYLP